MKPKLPAIYEYVDFRKYLEEYRKVRLEIDEKFTHYYICHRLGMKNSRSYFSNVIRGRKNIGSDTVQKFVELLELTSDEASYFRALVNFNQTTHADEKKDFLDKIVSLNITPRKIIEENAYRYFTTWFHPVIRELLDTFDFTGDFSQIAGKLDPPITAFEAEESIALLLELNLIEKNSDGFYKPNGKIVSTTDSVHSLLIDQYQLLSLERARERIVNRPQGHITTTMTIAVSRSALDDIIQQMAKARTSIRSIAYNDEKCSKKVYEVILHIHSQTT